MERTLSSIAVDRLAAAVRARLGEDRANDVRGYPEYGAVEVTTPSRPDGTLVVAAITEDAGSCAVVRYANQRAREFGLRMRATHSWNRRSAAMTDLMLTSVLFDCLDPSDAATAERAILHDPDAGRALRALSHECRLLVVSSATNPDGSRILGDTVTSLIGRVACPLAVVLPPASIPTVPWWTATPGTGERP